MFLLLLLNTHFNANVCFLSLPKCSMFFIQYLELKVCLFVHLSLSILLYKVSCVCLWSIFTVLCKTIRCVRRKYWLFAGNLHVSFVLGE